jgi:TolA-binding protein
MMRWFWWVALGLAAASAAAAFGPTPLRDRLYREVSYQYLADRLTSGASSDAERAVRLFDFVHGQVNVVGAPVVDDNPWNDLVRGIGWCDQQSWDLATLLSKQGIHARFAMLRTASGVSPHTVAEVKLGERWALFDPLNGLYYRKPDGTFATLEEVTGEPALIAQESKIRQLPSGVRETFLGSVSNFYPMGQEPTRWSSLLLKKNRSRGQRIVNRAIQVVVGALGKPFAHAYQDLYYATEGADGRSAEALLRRARNYHLYGRHAKAERTYRLLLERFPHRSQAEDAQFYLAAALTDLGRHAESLAQLKTLEARAPASKWNALIPYYAGRNYEAMGDIPQAVISYEQVAGNLDLDGPWRLSRLLMQGSR